MTTNEPFYGGPEEPRPGEILHRHLEDTQPGYNRYLVAVVNGEPNPNQYLPRRGRDGLISRFDRTPIIKLSFTEAQEMVAGSIDMVAKSQVTVAEKRSEPQLQAVE